MAVGQIVEDVGTHGKAAPVMATGVFFSQPGGTNREVDRWSTILGLPCRIMQPVGVPKAKELCESFSYTLIPNGNALGQERFLKGLVKLNKPKRNRRKVAA